MNSGLNESERLRQLRIDEEIDEAIKTIRALGGESGVSVRAPRPPSGNWFPALRAASNCSDTTGRKRDRWMRSATATIIAVAVAAFAGFFAGYNSRAPNPSDITLARSPEIRRAIPVEPEIRKAIPVQTRTPEVDRRSRSMQLRLGERQSHGKPRLWLRKSCQAKRRPQISTLEIGFGNSTGFMRREVDATTTNANRTEATNRLANLRALAEAVPSDPMVYKLLSNAIADYNRTLGQAKPSPSPKKQSEPRKGNKKQ